MLHLMFTLPELLIIASQFFAFLANFITLWSQKRERTSRSCPVFLGVDFESSTTCCYSPQRGNKRSYCALALRALCKNNNNNNKKKNHPVQCTVSPVRLQSGRPGVMHGQNREVRVSGWSGQMAGVIAATLNILFDFDSYLTPYSDLVPTEEALRWWWWWVGVGGQRLCKQDFFSNIKAHSRRNYF